MQDCATMRTRTVQPPLGLTPHSQKSPFSQKAANPEKSLLKKVASQANRRTTASLSGTNRLPSITTLTATALNQLSARKTPHRIKPPQHQDSSSAKRLI